ncbi:hypothetical protein CALCODRAFT_532675 [Calocera cornea HHB12733]|uniref:Pali-domain-containing protein n=1 Tax=Calocera cornea HHB12733 TaxID=1353952 RepID=A0A165IED5_9BASI|nr:hypothetical protein CALCODRAFT_532675 [Calocera cornea HHB12733]
MLLRLVAPVLWFAAFLLLLLATLSAPIVPHIFILSATAHIAPSLLGLHPASATDTVSFGVWGWLQAILQLSNEQSNAQLILKGVTTALVLHPLACGLAFLAWVLSFWLLLRPEAGRFALCAVLPVAWLAGTITTIAFVVDVVFVAVARGKVWDSTVGDVTIGFGNAVWIVLGAMVASWLALAGVCGAVCCGERGWGKGRARGRRG